MDGFACGWSDALHFSPLRSIPLRPAPPSSNSAATSILYSESCAASLPARLPHRVAYGLMISDTNMVAKEGWPLVDAMGESSCDPSSVDKFRPELPPVVHYCQVFAPSYA